MPYCLPSALQSEGVSSYVSRLRLLSTSGLGTAPAFAAGSADAAAGSAAAGSAAAFGAAEDAASGNSGVLGGSAEHAARAARAASRAMTETRHMPQGCIGSAALVYPRPAPARTGQAHPMCTEAFGRLRALRARRRASRAAGRRNAIFVGLSPHHLRHGADLPVGSAHVRRPDPVRPL